MNNKKLTIIGTVILAILIIISITLCIISNELENEESNPVIATQSVKNTEESTIKVDEQKNDKIEPQKAETEINKDTKKETTSTTETLTGKSDNKKVMVTKVNTNNESTTQRKTETSQTQTTQPAKTLPTKNIEAIETDMLKLMNEARTSEGLNKLAWNNNLYGIAIIRAKECSQNWAHERPNGEKYTSLYYEYGLEKQYGDAGENLAKGPADTSTAKVLFDALMASPGHRANIMNVKYTECGIAVYYGNDGNIYMAQNYGQKR